MSPPLATGFVKKKNIPWPFRYIIVLQTVKQKIFINYGDNLLFFGLLTTVRRRTTPYRFMMFILVIDYDKRHLLSAQLLLYCVRFKSSCAFSICIA